MKRDLLLAETILLADIEFGLPTLLSHTHEVVAVSSKDGVITMKRGKDKEIKETFENNRNVCG